ncbi:MAG: ECF transporter S component [Firmicutes bacterium]|nr:ECF transporter S component [Bacillota bacterium]
MDVKKIANVGVLTALSLILMLLIKIPYPPMPFLLYDPGDIPILIIGFLFGPVAALISTLINSIIMAAFVGDGIYGALMHFLSTGALVGVAAYIYHKSHNKKGAVKGLIAGTLSMVAIMVPANLVITPIFMGVDYKQVLSMILPFILPFNLIKALTNSMITFLVYKRIADFLRRTGLLRIDNTIKA